MSKLGPGDFHALSTPLEVALTQLGVKEGDPAWAEYVLAGGMDPAANPAWCVLFVRWCCSRVGIWLPKTASVKRFCEMAEDIRERDAPRPGDIVAHLRPDGLGHLAFFMNHSAKNADIWFTTVDGNTNAAGARNGDRVAIKDRPMGFWNMGHFRPRRPQ
jgi:hypothetical protein